MAVWERTKELEEEIQARLMKREAERRTRRLGEQGVKPNAAA